MSGAHTNHDNDFPVENIDASDVPIYSLPTLPTEAYIPLVVRQDDPSCGGSLLALYHLPLSRITPGGTFQNNTYSLAGNGFNASVPVDQVIPGYVRITPPNDIRQANATAGRAQFLIIEADPNVSGSYIVQRNGVYTFSEPHNYVVGYDYYLAEADGQVTTVAPVTNPQKLFTVLDSMTILISIQ